MGRPDIGIHVIELLRQSWSSRIENILVVIHIVLCQVCKDGLLWCNLRFHRSRVYLRLYPIVIMHLLRRYLLRAFNFKSKYLLLRGAYFMIFGIHADSTWWLNCITWYQTGTLPFLLLLHYEESLISRRWIISVPFALFLAWVVVRVKIVSVIPVHGIQALKRMRSHSVLWPGTLVSKRVETCRSLYWQKHILGNLTWWLNHHYSYWLNI